MPSEEKRLEILVETAEKERFDIIRKTTCEEKSIEVLEKRLTETA